MSPAPKGVKITGQYGVAPALVDVQHDPAQLRAALPQSLHQSAGGGAEAPCGHDTGHGVAGMQRPAAEYMPHYPAPALFVIGRNGVFIHEFHDRSGDLLTELVLQKAFVYGDELMAALPEKAVCGRSFALRHGENGLVAVALRFFAAENFGGSDALLSDMGKGVVHPAQLEVQLLIIAHMAEIAAAALAEIGA